MPWQPAGRNLILDSGIGGITHVSLHTGDPGSSGVNEVSGGTPVYARKPVTWAAGSSNGFRFSSNLITFDVPTSISIFYLGFWSALAAGTFYGWWPIGTLLNYNQMKAASLANTGDIVTAYSHGYANNDRVVFYDINALGIPTGLTEGTVYFVTNATTDTFTVSLTSGGATNTFSANAEAFIQRCIPVTTSAQGRYEIAIGDLYVDAVVV